MKVSILILLSILLSFYSWSADRYWVGTGTGNWNDVNNWSAINNSTSGASVPGIGDVAHFTGASLGNCSLDMNVSLSGIITTGYQGVIDLSGYTFDPGVGGSAICIFGGGSIINSLGVSTINISTSAEISFNSFTLGSPAWNINLNITGGEVSFEGSTFYGEINATQTGNSNTAGGGGNTFHDEVAFTNTGPGYFYFGFGNPDVFNGVVKLYNTGISSVRLAAGSVGTQFNENIEVNSSNGVGVQIGATLGGAVMANTKTITIGSNGFTVGTLGLKNFTQLGNSTQNITLTGTAGLLTDVGTKFEGDLNISAPNIELSASTFEGVVNLTKTGLGINDSNGNVFKENIVITHLGSDLLRFGAGFPDVFEKDLILYNQGDGGIDIAETSSGNIIGGDLSIFTSGNSKNVRVSLFAVSSIDIAGNVNINSGSSANVSNIYIGNEGDVNITGSLDFVQNATGDSSNIRIAETAFSQVTIGGVANLLNNGGGHARRIYLGYSGDIVFNNDLIVVNNATADLSGVYLNHFPGSTNNYNGEIILSNTSPDGISFGRGTGVPPGGYGELAVNKKVTIGPSGFTNGELYFRNFTQFGNTPQSILPTGTTKLTILYCDWQGGGDFISPRITTRNSLYGGVTHLEKTGALDDLSFGANQFSMNTTMRNTGSGAFNMGCNDGAAINYDLWGADLTVISESSGDITVAYQSSGNEIVGDLTITSNSTGIQNSYFSRFGVSTLEVGGNSTILNNGSSGDISVYLGLDGDINFLGDLTISNNATSNIGSIYVAYGVISEVMINGVSSLTNAGLGGSVKQIIAGLKGDVTFNNTLIVDNSSTASNDSYILFNSDSDSQNFYNGDIILNSSTNSASGLDGVYFGKNSGTTAGSGTLSNPYSITMGASNFIGDNLLFRNFTQLGGTPQSFIPPTGNTRFETKNSIWNGDVTFESGGMISNSSTFNGDAFLHKTGPTDSYSLGENIFNGTTVIQNSSTAILVFANLYSNDFNGDVTYRKTSTGEVKPTYNATSTYAGSITVDASSIVVFGDNSYGRVILDGSSAQSINVIGLTPRPEFRILETQNSMDEITLNTPIVISSVLHLGQGNLISSAINLITMNHNTSVTAVSDDAFVDGPLSKIGKDAFTFPVGKQGYYRPIGISSNTSSSQEFRAEYFAQDVVTNGIPDNPLDPTIDHVSSCEYWTLDRFNVTNGVQVTLSYRDIAAFSCSGVTVPSELLVCRWDGSMWKDHGNGGNTGTSSDGTIVSFGTVNNFSPFTLGTTTANNPLPIELISFDVIKQGTSALVNWTTASELNNDYFDIERSTDGYNFESIAIVDGAGNSSTIIDYDYLDREPKTGINYYRLKQTDYDGQFSYSDIKSVEFDAWDYLNIYPNPLVSGNVLSISSTQFITKVELTNGAGQLIRTYDFPGNSEEVKLKNLNISSGIYIVKIYSNEGVESKKLVVK